MSHSPLHLHFAGAADTWQSWLSATHAQAPATDTYAPHRQRLLHAAQSLLPLCEPARTPIILATTKGDIDSLTTWMRTENPFLANTPAPTLIDEAQSLARDLGLRGPAWVISAACASGLIAIIDAALSVQQSAADSALVLAIDVAGSFVRDGFNTLKALSPTTTCRPFDAHRDGITLGSGSAAALVTRTPIHASCQLSGWAAASDAVHLSAPDRHANGLIRTIRQALAHAHLQPTDIDLILAHGTGTRYNDAMESVAFRTIFSNGEKHPAITAVKGHIGHTLGASGLLESALASHILATQTIPPITNLQSPEYPDLDLVRQTRTANVRHILKVASGFGGFNAAVILSRPEGSVP